MVSEIPALKDDPKNWDPKQWAPYGNGNTPADQTQGFNGTVHGVVLISGDSKERLDIQHKKVSTIVGDSVNEVLVLNGKARPGAERGHEAFGFKDGVSQPFVAGTEDWVPPYQPGPNKVRPGVILLGRDGDLPEDIAGDAPPDAPGSVNRPSWAKDGSFMAFRFLQQKVPEFHAFIQKEASTVGIDPELMGARMVGRWKSGMLTAPCE
jgi:Dyp-type peroxidase family